MASSLPARNRAAELLAATPKDQRECRKCHKRRSEHCPSCSACPGDQCEDFCNVPDEGYALT